MADFERFVEIISKKEDKRVVNITVRPIVTDCEGNIWFTDIMLQEGDMLSGYTPHTKGFLKESENDPVWFNGIVRSEETVILLNLGGTSAGLDIHLYPKKDMDGGSVTLAQGVGGREALVINQPFAVQHPQPFNKGAKVFVQRHKLRLTLNRAQIIIIGDQAKGVGHEFQIEGP